MKAFRGRTAWLYAIALVTLFMLTVFVVTDIRYDTVDDAPTVRMFMGYEGGTPGGFHLYYHTFLARFLQGISLLFPGVAWVSIMQLAFVWLANVVIVKNLMAVLIRKRHKLWEGLGFAGAYLGVFAFHFVSCPTYTTVAALLGAAAVAQLLGMETGTGQGKDVFCSTLLSGALLFGSYLLRQIAVVPSLVFWLLGFFWLLWKDQLYENRERLKPLVQGCGVWFCVFLIAIGVRAAEIKTLGLEEYYAWHSARIELFDYTDFEGNPQRNTREETGWSDEKMELVKRWYFLDEDITSTALKAQAEAQTSTRGQGESLPVKIIGSLKAIKVYWTEEPQWLFVLGLLLLWTVAGVGLAAAGGSKQMFQWLAVPSGICLGGILLLYLGWNGRIVPRSYASVLLPMSTFVAAGLFTFGGNFERAPKAGIAVMVAGTLFFGGACSLMHYRWLTRPGIVEYCQKHLNIANYMEDFARENPKKLIVYDVTRFRDYRLFPNTTGGVPTNLMAWGDWECRTPHWYAQFEAFGLDGYDFTPEDFLKEPILVMGETLEGPTAFLTEHIREYTGQNVMPKLYGQNGFCYFFQYVLEP